jgi:hypothetical protein
MQFFCSGEASLEGTESAEVQCAVLFNSFGAPFGDLSTVGSLPCWCRLLLVSLTKVYTKYTLKSATAIELLEYYWDFLRLRLLPLRSKRRGSKTLLYVVDIKEIFDQPTPANIPR